MKKTKQVAVIGLFAAVIVVLQLMSYVIKLGPFNLSLVLIPIVIGAVLYGPKVGAILGAVFGVVVTITSAAGLDAGGFILWGVNPMLTALVCLVKGTAAGWVAGLIGKAMQNKNALLTTAVAAMAAPVVNTGLFVLGMFSFFQETLAQWAGGSDVLTYVLTGLVGINFIIEFSLNIIFSSATTRVIGAVRKI